MGPRFLSGVLTAALLLAWSSDTRACDASYWTADDESGCLTSAARAEEAPPCGARARLAVGRPKMSHPTDVDWTGLEPDRSPVAPLDASFFVFVCVVSANA